MKVNHSLDAVILAGGKSERLGGIVPPYHKPFLVINGKSLLVSAVETAAVYAEKVVVVATGENAMPVMQLVGHRPQVRVVLSNGGPGRALYVGLEMCDSQRVLVMMSDNVFGCDDVANVVGEKYAVGVREMSWCKSLRFTRHVNGQWREGPAGAEERANAPDKTKVWCGPLVIQRQRGLDALEGQEKIGPVIGDLAPTFTHVPTQTVDVGIPSIVTELTRRDVIL